MYSMRKLTRSNELINEGHESLKKEEYNSDKR